MRYTADNIVAIASGTGYAGVGVIRVSGKDISKVIHGLTGKTELTPRYAHYCDFYNRTGEVLDSGLALYFANPRSFTGEDVLEIQAHGSPVVLNMLLSRCLELGCRMAEAGEFTKRAFLNDKLDLVQAESISDLIHADSVASAKGALKSLKGEFSRLIEAINERLINLRMFVEASLDFPDEDIEFIANAKIRAKLEELKVELAKLLGSTQQGVILNNGANIVIVGRPNVGKSSLLNALANEDIAIVTDIAGTTRDIVQQKIVIAGVPFNIFDTAGIRVTEDAVEKIGIERALCAIQNADLALILIDDSIGMSPEDEDIVFHIPSNLPRIFVHNKIDLTNSQPALIEDGKISHVYISAKHMLGINVLRDKLLQLIGWQNNQGDAFTARTRHLDAMRLTVTHIDNAFANWEDLDLLAEELRYAHSALGTITGDFSVDDLLGEIFSKFCIGK